MPKDGENEKDEARMLHVAMAWPMDELVVTSHQGRSSRRGWDSWKYER